MEADKDLILAKTALKATAPEFVPSALAKAVPERTTTSTTRIDDKEVMPVVEVKPLPKPEVPETVPESPEDSDDDVHVVLRTTEICPLPREHPKLTATTNVVFHPPPMRHRDTTDSIESTDSERSLDSPVRDKDDSANLGDLSDSGSEAGSLPTHDACEAGDDESDEPDPEVPELSLRPEQVTHKGAGDITKQLKEAVSTDDDLPPFVPPDDELARKIVDQVEFYFSDVNITKDAFLLKHVKRNKEGYVSLKLISSFKRVKHIARDWRVVAYALKNSTKLEINEAGTKLRRVDPLPAYDQTTPSRTVVAINLPHDKPTIESVAELFRPCGDIALVRILRPGNPIPADVRSFVSKHPEMHGVVSALVEFVRTESALAAVGKRDWDWRAPGDITVMRVLELNAPASPQATERIKKRNAANKKNILGKYSVGEYEYSSCASGSEAELEQRYLRGMQRRGSSPLDCLPMTTMPGKHWLQRRYSRDSGCEDMGYHRTPSSGSLYSDYSRSRSNSGASFDLGVRRMSAGWESGSESCCSGRSSRSNSAAFIMEGLGMTGRRYSAGKDSDSDGYGSFRSRKSSAASDLSGRRDSCGGGGPPTGRRNSGVHDDDPLASPPAYMPPRRGSHQMHLEHQLLRRVTALGLGDPHPRECCSCHCRPALPPPPHAHECRGRRGSADLQMPRKPMVGFAHTFAPNFGSSSAPSTPTEPVRRVSGAGMPENIMRMPRGPDGGRGFLRESDIPEVC